MAQKGLDRAQIEQILIPEIIALNPDCKQQGRTDKYLEDGNLRPSAPSEDGVMVGRLEFNAEDELIEFDLHGCRLERLPDSICHIRTIGSFDLGGNQLTQLPEGFGNIVVGKHCWLNNNSLEALPPGFEQISVGGTLNLDQAFEHGKDPKLQAEQFPNAKYFLGGAGGH